MSIDDLSLPEDLEAAVKELSESQGFNFKVPEGTVPAGKGFLRWKEAVVIEEAYREPKDGRDNWVSYVIGLKVLPDSPNAGKTKKNWSQIDLNALRTGEPNNMAIMNRISLSLLRSLVVALLGPVDNVLETLNQCFPPRGEDSPIAGQKAVLRVSENPNKKDYNDENQQNFDGFLPLTEGE